MSVVGWSMTIYGGVINSPSNDHERLLCFFDREVNRFIDKKCVFAPAVNLSFAPFSKGQVLGYKIADIFVCCCLEGAR